MPTYLVNPPSQFVIPVTLGADQEFSVSRVDTSNNPVDWNALVYITIDVDPDFPTTVQGVVTGNQAVILLPVTINDQVGVRTRWRLYMQTSNGSGPLTLPICVGHFERDDGSAP